MEIRYNNKILKIKKNKKVFDIKIFYKFKKFNQIRQIFHIIKTNQFILSKKNAIKLLKYLGNNLK